jgi:parvulin-like peptidyl-prolyl isomerase
MTLRCDGPTPDRSLRRPGRWRPSTACLILVAALAAAALGAIGCGGDQPRKGALSEEEIQRMALAAKPVAADEILVSGERITCEDIMNISPGTGPSDVSFKQWLEEVAKATTLEQFIELARPRVRQQLGANVSNIVLYKRARRQLGDRIDDTLDKLVEKELRRFVIEHGGNNAQADEALKEMGMNRATFKENKKKQILAQYAVESKMARSRPITYSELVATYDRIKEQAFVQPGLVQFRLIDISAGKIELADPDDDPVVAARKLAEELVTRIVAGEDFGQLAEEYSRYAEHYVKGSEGLWPARDPESLAEPYRALAPAAAKIEVGQIAGPIDVPGHAFIMKLVEKRPKGYLPMSQVQERVEANIEETRRLEAIARLDAEIVEQMALADTDRFLNDCLERLYRAANPPAPVP